MVPTRAQPRAPPTPRAPLGRQGLLNRRERVELFSKLGGRQRTERSTAEIMDMLQAQVDAKSAKFVFQSFDENRSGRISVREHERKSNAIVVDG